MAAKPRVHEIAHELGVDSKDVLRFLKLQGEFVKGPSSSIQVPVARRVREAFRKAAAEAVDEPTPTHPEAIAAKARRDVVQRSESDWSKFGLTPADREAWIEAGVPADKAHVAAMCRDSERRDSGSSRLTIRNLHRHLGSDAADTVLSSLLSGQNSLRVQERLASTMGVEITGVNDDLLRVTTSGRRAPETEAPALAKAFAALQWEPRNTPLLADSGAAVLTARAPWVTAHRILREQVVAFRENRTVSPLLSAFARVHGVFHVGAELELLCEGVLGEPRAYASALDAAKTFIAATQSRRFYFFRPDALEAIEAAVQLYQPDSLPPSPHGVALLPGNDSPQADTRRPYRLLAWTTTAQGIKCFVTTAATFTDPSGRKLIRADAVETWDATSSGPASSLLNAIAVSRSRPLGRTRHPRGVTLEDSPEPSDAATAIRDVVVTYFAASSTDAVLSSPRHRRAPDHQWQVQGHWRRQWYPRAKAHETIWIDEHTSGPSGRPLLLSERVEVH